MIRRALGALFILLMLTACQPRWQAQMVIERRESVFAASEWRALAKEWLEKEGSEGALPLERILWERGARAVEEINVDGASFSWGDYYDKSWWLPDGQLRLGQQLLRPARVEVIAPALLGEVQASLMDVAPTALAALGAPPLAGAEGRVLTSEPARYVALIFLDGLIRVLHKGIFSAWLMASIYIGLLGFGFLFRVLGGKWRSMRVIEEPGHCIAVCPPEIPVVD